MPASLEHRCGAMPQGVTPAQWSEAIGWWFNYQGESSVAGLAFCPWCGARLERPEPPISLAMPRDRWLDLVKTMDSRDGKGLQEWSYTLREELKLGWIE